MPTKEMTITRKKEIQRIIEGLLFSSSEPLNLGKIKEIIGIHYPISPSEIKSHIAALNAEYEKENRAFQIDEIAHGYLLRTSADVSFYVERLHANRKGERLSKAAYEVLAIVAYKQPITRLEIEKLRGSDPSGTLSSLMERGLVEIVGRLEAPGRPSQYGITKRFLRHFGLKALSDLRLE